MNEQRVLVVEDDGDVAASVQTVLRRAGHEVTWVADGRRALEAHASSRPDLVVLDINLPGLDGWAVLRRIRERGGTPVLVLTARALEVDKVRGLAGGADDYLTKPFTVAELAARVGAILRRSPPPPAQDGAAYDDGVVRLEGTGPTVSVGGQPVALTPTEVRLLETLVAHPNQVLSPDQLLAVAWQDPTGLGHGRVRFAVASLRRKCGWQASATSPVQTVRGFGYRYQPGSPAR